MRPNVTMRSLVLAVAFSSVSLMVAVDGAAQNKATIPAGAKVYIDPHGAEFDISAELERQKVPLETVSAEDQAHFVIANSETKDLKLGKLRDGISLQVRRTGTLTVRDTSSNTVVWSEDWQVNSYDPKDERKAASRLVDKLRKSVRQQR